MEKVCRAFRERWAGREILDVRCAEKSENDYSWQLGFLLPPPPQKAKHLSRKVDDSQAENFWQIETSTHYSREMENLSTRSKLHQKAITEVHRQILFSFFSSPSHPSHKFIIHFLSISTPSANPFPLSENEKTFSPLLALVLFTKKQKKRKKLIN